MAKRWTGIYTMLAPAFALEGDDINHLDREALRKGRLRPSPDRSENPPSFCGCCNNCGKEPNSRWLLVEDRFAQCPNCGRAFEIFDDRGFYQHAPDLAEAGRDWLEEHQTGRGAR